MKYALILFFCIGFLLTFAQEPVDSIPSKGSSIGKRIRVRADIGLSRKFGDWQSTDHPGFNYLLQELKFSAVKTLAVDYVIKDKGNQKVLLGLLYSHIGGQKTVPSMNFVDSLGNKFVSDYIYNNSYSTIALSISGARYIGSGEQVQLLSALQLGKTWYKSEETAVFTKEYNGSTITYGAMLGLDFKVSSRISIGGEVRAWYAKIGTLTVTEEVELEEVETELQLQDLDQVNLSRLDFTIGARYWF